MSMILEQHRAGRDDKAVKLNRAPETNWLGGGDFECGDHARASPGGRQQRRAAALHRSVAWRNAEQWLFPILETAVANRSEPAPPASYNLGVFSRQRRVSGFNPPLAS
jgi:hypothetical protein